MSTDREQLIKDAMRAIANADQQFVEGMDEHALEVMYGAQARAAAAVFEKAHTPSLTVSDAHSSSVSVSEANTPTDEGTREEEWALLARDFAPEVHRAAGTAFRLGWDYSILRRPVHTPTDEQTEVGVINYCPFHGDLLNIPEDGRDTRSERCRNTHSIESLRQARRIDTPTDDETVEWRSVVGYEGMYEVSETGEVRSVARTVQRSNGADQAVPGKMLTKHPDRRGYHLVSLTRDHKVVHRRVHRLVLEAFVGPCPEGHEGLHGDGDMHNNHRSNLRWGTRAENVHDSMRHGTLPVGEAAAASKITEQDVRDIRAAQKAGESMRGLARRYGLALSTVQAIVHRRSWNHVI